MAWNDKLVSVIILTYNCLDMLPRALDSVFSQDYPRIEIIISDDGSKDFDRESIETYIEQYKTPNIERTCIVRSEENTGTVKNLRRALEVMQGDYYINFGSDDALFSNTVISDFIYTFCVRGWKPLLVTGLTAMYGTIDYKMYRGSIPTKQDVSVLVKEDPAATLNALASRCVVSTVSTCYRRDFPEKVGAYDTIYKYYEDYPSFLRMARKGYTPVFIDRLMTKHAPGGVANGSVDKEISKRFFDDRKLMWKTEFEPYKNMFSRDAIVGNKERRALEKRIYKKSIGAAKVSGVFNRIVKNINGFLSNCAKKDSHYFQMASLFGTLFVAIWLLQFQHDVLRTLFLAVSGIAAIIFAVFDFLVLIVKLKNKIKK